MTPELITVETLGELIDQHTPSQPDKRTGRRRATKLEGHILRNFIRYSRAYLTPQPVNDWELLALAQHHGLPTRLLDWTYSPLVAAHVATFKVEPRSDQVIWRLDWMQVHRHFSIPLLALLIEDLDELFSSEGGFTPWDLFKRGRGSEDFACLLEPHR